MFIFYERIFIFLIEKSLPSWNASKAPTSFENLWHFLPLYRCFYASTFTEFWGYASLFRYYLARESFEILHRLTVVYYFYFLYISLKINFINLTEEVVLFIWRIFYFWKEWLTILRWRSKCKLLILENIIYSSSLLKIARKIIHFLFLGISLVIHPLKFHKQFFISNLWTFIVFWYFSTYVIFGGLIYVDVSPSQFFERLVSGVKLI